MASIFKSLFGKKGAPVEGGAPEITAASTPTPAKAATKAMPGAEPVPVTDDTFEELVLNAPLPAMVDFWAPWCGPCRMVSPIVEDLARDYQGRVVVAKLNTDENLQIAGELGIVGIPTLILFKDGREIDRVVGYAPRHALEDKLQAILD